IFASVFQNQSDRVGQILPCFITCARLTIRARDLRTIGNHPFSVLLKDRGKFIVHMLSVRHFGASGKRRVNCVSYPADVSYAAIMSSQTNIESLQVEGRIFQPPETFAAMSHIKSMAELEALRAEASADPEAFWARLAESELHWFKKWDEVLK